METLYALLGSMVHDGIRSMFMVSIECDGRWMMMNRIDNDAAREGASLNWLRLNGLVDESITRHLKAKALSSKDKRKRLTRVTKRYMVETIALDLVTIGRVMDEVMIVSEKRFVRQDWRDSKVDALMRKLRPYLKRVITMRAKLA